MKTKLIQKKIESGLIKSFIFEKPKNFKFYPGQFTYLTLPRLNYPDNKGGTRVFTISSSPTEKRVVITTKIRQESGFKKTLDKLKTGEIVEIREAMGNFTLYKNTFNKHVFLAGGIGITPFRSIIKYHRDKSLKNNIHLIWSVKKTKEIPFREEIENWQRENLIKINITITEKVTKNWKGLTGRINKEMLEKLISKKDLSKVKFWICGSTAFVSAMEEILSKLKIEEKNITSEKFTGY